MVNTEEMRRAASSMSEASDEMRRTANSFSDSVDRLERLFGQGYGSNIDRLIEAIENMPSGNT